MKSLAKLYVVLLIIFYIHTLTNDAGTLDQWQDLKTCLHWFICALGVFALVSYGYSLETLTYVRTQKRWLVALIMMLSFYSYHFYSLDYFASSMNDDHRKTILLNYLLLVLPPTLCTTYLAFRKA